MPEGVEISNNSFAFTRPLERNDSGVYRCEVTNDIGLRSQDVNLWVQGNVSLFFFWSVIDWMYLYHSSLQFLIPG